MDKEQLIKDLRHCSIDLHTLAKTAVLPKDTAIFAQMACGIVEMCNVLERPQ